MSDTEKYVSLGDASVQIPIEMANKALNLLKKQPDADLLIEILGLDGAENTEPRCVKHNVKKTFAVSGYYCKACKSGREKATRERRKSEKEKEKEKEK